MPWESGRVGIGVGVEGGVGGGMVVGKVVCDEGLAVGLAFWPCRGLEPGRQLFGCGVGSGSECGYGVGHDCCTGEGARGVGVDEDGVGFVGWGFVAVVEFVPVALLRGGVVEGFGAEGVRFSGSAFLFEGFEV